MTFTSLSEAIEWAEARWHERPAPIRLHARDIDGQLGLQYSRPFARLLSAHPNQTHEAEMTEPCYHPTIRAGQSIRECPACSGMGVKTALREVWDYPMWRACERLAKDRATRPHLPTPGLLVERLAEHRWRPMAAAYNLGLPWDLAEPLFLMALRKLRGYYTDAPIPRRSWVDLSESQQNAEGATAA